MPCPIKAYHRQIADQQQSELFGKIFSCCGTGNKKNVRKPRNRTTEILPEEVQRLIIKMTARSEKERTSVRQARKYYPWIFDALADDENTTTTTRTSTDYKIKYLNLSDKQEKDDTDKGKEGEKAAEEEENAEA